MKKLRWEIVLGILAVAAVLLAIPLVRPDIDKFFHTPEWIFLAFAISGSILALGGLVGILILLFSLVFARPTTWCEFKPVSRRDVRQVFDLMKSYFGEETPSCTRIMDWQRRNRAVLTAVYCNKLRGGWSKKELVGVFKVLPLNDVAVRLVEAEQLSGATITTRHIAAEGEAVAALYIGDVVASTHSGRAAVVQQLKLAVNRQLKPGLPVYTRPLTADGSRLVRKYGFMPVFDEVAPGSAGRIHKFVKD